MFVPALKHFDVLYYRFYGKMWPSIRLGLLSPKKMCAVANMFVSDEIKLSGALDLKNYYDQHLRAYTRHMARQQIISNKKSRRREINETVEGNEATEVSSAEDLVEMFSDRRLDEDEKYFYNQASPNIGLNEFVPATNKIYHEDLPDESQYYEGYDSTLQLDIPYIEEPFIEFSEQLKVYSFPRNDWSNFEKPTEIPPAQLYPYYLMDGASVLPVLALNLKANDDCADYCAAPGGKSLAIMMTLRPQSLICNDIKRARLERLSRVMRQYLPDISYIRSTLRLSNHDARSFVQPNAFDKILVDVPCSNDRNSLESLDNNIFKRARTNERLELPANQGKILKSALKSLKLNGIAVYSTCTLSPIENDGVVQQTLLQLIQEGHKSKFAIVNLKEAFRPLRGLYKFNTKCKYGQQVLPSVTSNYGPMYICAIKRIE